MKPTIASAAIATTLLSGVWASSSPALAQAPAPFQTNWSIQAINAPAAYAKGFDGSGVLIAIIDDGYDLTHPAFQGKIVEALNTAGAGPIAPLFHGTHVAGIASGIAPGANLALYTYGFPLNSPTPFLTAAAQRPAVISNSWGIDVDVNEILNQPSFSMSPYQALSDRLGSTPADFKAFADALISAQQHSVILFAASNDPNLPDMDISAGLPLVIPQLQGAWIAVVNVDRNGDVISVTCGSAAQFCLAAPGVDILSAVPGGGYGTATGTSMATPHVAGAVAIARQIFPVASPSQLTSLVLQTATDAGARGVDPVYGWGYLNLGNIIDTINPQTATTFANASWSRFSTLQHVGSAIPAYST
jgi:subtilase-type serine protease